MVANILIVEDEEKLARFIELELLHEGYHVDKSYDGRDAYEKAVNNEYDLILLDIMLPGLNGLEVLRRVREVKEIPVILLTARDAVMDKVAGLDAGACDYITKPFAIEELLARIRVALKLHPISQNVRSGDDIATEEKKDGVYTWGKLKLDEISRRVTYGNEKIELTNREFLMLKELLVNENIVLSRDTLLEKVCGYDYIGETNLVDVYVRYLRSKIDQEYDVKMIETVRGVGYVIRSFS